MQAIRYIFLALLILPLAAHAEEKPRMDTPVPLLPGAEGASVLERGRGVDVVVPLELPLPAPATEPAPPAMDLYTLTAVFPLNSIVDWVQAKSSLRKTKSVKEFRELEVTTGFARVELSHTGTPEELAAELQKSGLSLLRQDNEWILRRL